MRRRAFLVAVPIALLATVALLIVLPSVRASILVPAIMVLPGYLATVALLPERRDITEQLILSLVISTTLVIAIGLGFNLAGIPIGPLAWFAVLAVIALTAAGMAFKRRQQLSKPMHIRLPRARDMLLTLLAFMLVSFAIQLATIGARESRTAGDQSVPVLWLEPVAGSQTELSVGVGNIGSAHGAFRLDVVARGSVLESYRIELDGRSQWSTTFTVGPSQGRVDVMLFAFGSSEVLRHVWRA
jgi:hypothetical protein